LPSCADALKLIAALQEAATRKCGDPVPDPDLLSENSPMKNHLMRRED
jgi:hypothetical protein